MIRAALIAWLGLGGVASACDYPGPPPGAGDAHVDAGRGILWAGFSDATERYRHGVLGDAVEAGGLRAAGAGLGPCDLAVLLPANRVFEDLSPRLFDLDGDGAHEIVVVETDVNRGAQLAVYGLRGGRLEKLAATPHIGRPKRWLAPLGAADLDGDGAVEIAYVDRPHLAKTLRVWRWRGGRLSHVADLPGITNHRIGEDFISGGIRDCGAGPEIIAADAAWQQVMAVRLKDGKLTARAIAPFDGPAALDRALDCR